MIRRLLAALYDLDHLVRFHQLGYVIVWPLLGWASIRAWSPLSMVWIVAVMFFWQTYGAVLNDVVDLPIDRKDPLRSKRWLVRGTLSTDQALGIAFAQWPLMLAAHVSAGFPRRALIWLLIAAVGEGLYDLFGKKCRIPILTEAAQGAAASALVVYGAAVSGQEPNALTWLTAGAASSFVLLVNGFHGSLRDLEVEIECMGHTAAIWLGCRPGNGKAVHISIWMSLYAGVCQAGVIALSLVLATRLAAPGDRFAAVVVVLVASLLNGALFLALHRMRKAAWDLVLRLHVVMVMIPVMLAFLPRLGAVGGAVLFLSYFGPTVLTAYWWYDRSQRRVLTFTAATYPSPAASAATSVQTGL